MARIERAAALRDPEPHTTEELKSRFTDEVTQLRQPSMLCCRLVHEYKAIILSHPPEGIGYTKETLQCSNKACTVCQKMVHPISHMHYIDPNHSRAPERRIFIRPSRAIYISTNDSTGPQNADEIGRAWLEPRTLHEKGL